MSAQQLHATDGGMFMDKEDTMGAMKDGVSHINTPPFTNFRPLLSLSSMKVESCSLLMLAAQT